MILIPYYLICGSICSGNKQEEKKFNDPANDYHEYEKGLISSGKHCISIMLSLVNL